MKLVHYGNEGSERPGLIDDSGILRNLSQHIPDVSSSILSDSSLEKLRKIEMGTWHAPRVICFGRKPIHGNFINWRISFAGIPKVGSAGRHLSVELKTRVSRTLGVR